MCNSELWDMQTLDQQRKDMGLYEEEEDSEPFDSGVFSKNKNQKIIKVKKSNNKY